MDSNKWVKSQKSRQNDLKRLSFDIKNIKKDLKESQRKLSMVIFDYNLPTDTSIRDIKYNKYINSTVKSVYYKNLDNVRYLSTQYIKLKEMYRFDHLVYCLYKKYHYVKSSFNS